MQNPGKSVKNKGQLSESSTNVTPTKSEGQLYIVILQDIRFYIKTAFGLNNNLQNAKES